MVHDPGAVAEDWWAEHLAALTGCTIRYGDPLEGSAVSRVIVGSLQAFIPLEGLVDVDAERERLKKALADGEADLERSRSKLANPNFRDRAPAEVVAGEEAKVAGRRGTLGEALGATRGVGLTWNHPFPRSRPARTLRRFSTNGSAKVSSRDSSVSPDSSASWATHTSTIR